MTFAPVHPGLDPLADNYSESVLLAAIASDARSGVFARLCRYPDAGVAWIWLHVATPDGEWTFVDDNAPCSRDRLDVDAADLVYTAGPVTAATWSRSGSRRAPTAAALRAEIPGAVPVSVEATFEPVHTSGASLRGRSEVLGRAAVHVSSDSIDTEFEAVAQWHEQEQSAPRFLVPFTYASLLSDDAAVLALIGPRQSGGFLRGALGERSLEQVDIAAAGGGTFDITAQAEGDVLSGSAVAVHEYELPVYGRRWFGAFVTAELAGSRLTGFVNRWQPDQGGGE